MVASNQRQAPTCSSTLHELVRSIRRRSLQETLHFEMYREQDTALRTHAEDRNKTHSIADVQRWKPDRPAGDCKCSSELLAKTAANCPI